MIVRYFTQTLKEICFPIVDKILDPTYYAW